MSRIIIADPDPLSRNAIFLWLVYKLGIDEIVQVADGKELIEQIEDFVPDLVLIDWGIHNRPSKETCHDLKEKYPALQWVILSVDASVSSAMKYCSPWFLQKGASPEEVMSLLQKVINI